MGLEYNEFRSSVIINLKETLNSGQIFSFKETEYGFVGPINNKLYILQENSYKNDKAIKYICLDENSTEEDCKKDLFAFFNLQINYLTLPNYVPGLCILSVDPIECIFSFICSQNNNVKRISSMVQFLFSLGDPIIFEGEKFYKFPNLENLIDKEELLIKNKFGYRSKYICETAKILLNKNVSVLRSLEYAVLHDFLNTLKGVGAKVADCICLYAFNFFSVVPIDIHIFRKSKDMFDLQIKSLTKSNHNLIKEKWIEKFGENAGIVQLFIFYEALKNTKITKK